LVQTQEDLKDRGVWRRCDRSAKLHPADICGRNYCWWNDALCHGALRAARRRGATTVFYCVPVERVSAEADIDIRGRAGSTGWICSPLKAGTATKLALNILSTGVMVQLSRSLRRRAGRCSGYRSEAARSRPADSAKESHRSTSSTAASILNKVWHGQIVC